MTPGRGTNCACPLKRRGQVASDSSLAGKKKEKNNPGQMVQKKLKDQEKEKK